jgi:uncharacterized RDD family membrane protein YckC
MTSATERASLLLEGAVRRKESIVSPEGVPMSVEVASYGDRLAAFILDSLFWTVATVLLIVAVLLSGGVALGLSAGVSLAVFAAFLIRNLYMIHFELVWRGATPGKRLMGIKVIDRHGGPLLPGAVIARNLTREIEYFLPVGLLSAGAARGAPWLALCLGLWFLLFTLLPLFNRQRLRAGDLIAGTMVVVRRGASFWTISPSIRRASSSPSANCGPMAPSSSRYWRNCCGAPRQGCRAAAPRGDGQDLPQDRLTEPVGDTEVEQLRDFYAAERAFSSASSSTAGPGEQEDMGKPAVGG